MIDWSTIFDCCGANVVSNFATGKMSVRDFATTCTEARKATRAYGADNVRERARKALRRRGVSLS